MGQTVLNELVIQYGEKDAYINSDSASFGVKGNQVNIPDPVMEIDSSESEAVTQATTETSMVVLGRVFFSLLRVHKPLNRFVRSKGSRLCKAPLISWRPEYYCRPLKIRVWR